MCRLPWVFVFLASCSFAATKGTDTEYGSLPMYQGTWQVTRNGAPAGSKPEILVNKCAGVGSFYTCAQTVGGQSTGLLIFIPKGLADHYFTQVIKPDGRATGRDELEIESNVWTYRSRRDENGKTTFYRTINSFSGKNKIHFESAHSSNEKDWTTDSSGDDVRTAP